MKNANRLPTPFAHHPFDTADKISSTRIGLLFPHFHLGYYSSIFSLYQTLSLNKAPLHFFLQSSCSIHHVFPHHPANGGGNTLKHLSNSVSIGGAFPKSCWVKNSYCVYLRGGVLLLTKEAILHNNTKRSSRVVTEHGVEDTSSVARVSTLGAPAAHQFRAQGMLLPPVLLLRQSHDGDDHFRG